MANRPKRSATPEPLLKTIIHCLEDDKAEEIVAIDLAGKTAMADYMVVASGRSQRHVGALADHLVQKLQEVGVKAPEPEGKSACDWVLIDAGDILIHVFRPEVRAFYNLEKMWQAELETAEPAPRKKTASKTKVEDGMIEEAPSSSAAVDNDLGEKPKRVRTPRSKTTADDEKPKAIKSRAAVATKRRTAKSKLDADPA